MASSGDSIATESPAIRSLLFRIAGRDYVCPVTTLREVIPTRPATRIPCAPAHVVGLVNIRGTIVTVIDGGRYLHNTASDRQHGSMLLVDVGARVAGILVDRVIDIRAIHDEDAYEPLDLRDLVSRLVAIEEN